MKHRIKNVVLVRNRYISILVKTLIIFLVILGLLTTLGTLASQYEVEVISLFVHELSLIFYPFIGSYLIAGINRRAKANPGSYRGRDYNEDGVIDSDESTRFDVEAGAALLASMFIYFAFLFFEIEFKFIKSIVLTILITPFIQALLRR